MGFGSNGIRRDQAGLVGLVGRRVDERLEFRLNRTLALHTKRMDFVLANEVFHVPQTFGI